MFLRDQPHTSSEPETPMPELLEDFKARRVDLMAQTRELERLRQQVRVSAEREAAAIVTAARRNVRQVLFDARRELLVLVAQLQAVGCEAQAADLSRNTVQGETTSTSTITRASAATIPELVSGGELVSGARRDVREVLLEAQSELVALAEEARELRARIARQHGPPAELQDTDTSAPDVGEDAAPLPPLPSDQSPPVFFARRQIQDAVSQYTPLASSPRVWIAIAGTVAFAVISVVVFLASSGRGVSSSATTTQSLSLNRPAAGNVPKAVESVLTASPLAAPASGRSVLSVTIDTRRPAWIRTTVDGRADVGRVFKAGEKKTVSAREEIVMRTGDAGAVFVSVNGAQARALGADGRIVTRRFGNPTATAAPQPAALQAAAESRPTPNGSPVEIASAPSDVGTTGTSETATKPAAARPEREILRATQQWFEAYFAGNAEAMRHIATPDFSLVDERAGGRRLPSTMAGVDRGLQQVRIEVAGDGAVMSARLTERANVDGQLREYVSLVSGVWIRAEGQWRLMGVRFMDPSTLGS